jgi:glucose-6-phosphate isomerase
VIELPGFSANLGGYQASVEAALASMQDGQIIRRIWGGDHTVWKPEPAEISNRLGWLDCPAAMESELPRLQALARSLMDEGYTTALLLGMGGSSLAPEVMAKIFGVQRGYLDLSILDSTDPQAILERAGGLDPNRTLFIVSTKSGGTVETLSFFKYFYNIMLEALGAERAGEHFIAITDPGSTLVDLAKEYHFRATLLNDPNIGGRYSALSFFGLAPAALTGLDVARILQCARNEAGNSRVEASGIAGGNRGAMLGAILGELALAGRDKVTLISSPDLCAFGDWVEQLIAESTGKEGKGILPVVGEPVGNPEVYGDDRLFVYLHLRSDHSEDLSVLALEAAGHPVVRLELDDPFDLGGQFFLWEMATCIAGYRLGINPFDQPNVEAAKVLAREMVQVYKTQGRLPDLQPTLQDSGITVYGGTPAGSLRDALRKFLAQAEAGAYCSVQAYIHPGSESDAMLLELRSRLRETTRLAVTTGYGPRFLHSTGQLHKGDAGRGLFIQLTADSSQDAAIPDVAGQTTSTISFGVLKLAQALGDYQALLAAGRKVLRLHLGDDPLISLSRVTKVLLP